MNNENKPLNTTLSIDINENMTIIEEEFKDCPDVVRRKLNLKNGKDAYFIYIKGLIDNDLLQRDLIGPILSMNCINSIDKRALENLPISNIGFHSDPNILISEISSGNIVFIADGLEYAAIFKLEKYEKRSIQEPVTEKNIKGPHDGFIESLDVNLAILRNKIKNNNLKFKILRIGTSTNQKVVVAYIDGIADMKLLDALLKKIGAIDFDGLVAIGYIDQFIMDFPNSPFPQYQSTERPDKAIAGLLEGRFIILLDGTPVVLIVPVTYFSFFHSLDDYSHNWMFGSFLGVIRVIATFIAVFLPALYVAITSFHYYMVPVDLLIPLAESRVAVPFSPIVETLTLEITIELIHEAAVRLPTYISTTIGIVGGLVIGQAAVEAGIVSNLLIIIIAVTTIATYVIPNDDMGLALRLGRFITVITSAIFGLIGIVVCGLLFLAHLVTLESLGQPYFQPIAPFKKMDLKDILIRLPIKYHKKRPDVAKPIDNRRGKNNDWR